MMIRRLALAAVLSGVAGCGRVGFQERPGGDAGDDTVGGPGDQLTLIVTTDQYLAEPAGRPIAGATVLVERAGGTDRLTTGADGRVQFAAGGATAVHAIYKGDLGWRGYTVDLSLAASPTATIELGGRPASNPNHNMTFTLPSSGGTASYTVRVPEHCAFPPLTSTPRVATSFDAGCEGASGRAIGLALFAVGSGMPDLYVDGGTVRLSDGATVPIGGNYQPVPQRTLQISHLPLVTESVSAEIVLRAGIDVTSLTPTTGTATQPSGATAITMGVVPGGNAVSVSVSAMMPLQYLSTTTRIAPLPSTAATFDAGAMLPMFDALVLTDPTRMAWRGAAGGTITTAERNAGGVQWDWYLSPAATVAALPAIPGDLGVPAPALPDYAEVVKLDVPGVTGGDLLQTIDRRWLSWPHDEQLQPQAGSSEAKIFYTAGLGPP